jgi:YD repeat-containing protein
VDIYNGNLVFNHQDTAMNGNLMPVSITHTYNSCLSSSNEVGCGSGWRTSAHHSVHKKTVSGVDYYIWTDGGGTEHWFKVTGTQPYADDQGMKLKLRVNTSDITIEDKGHNVMTFPKATDATKKYITKATDACGNHADYAYTNGLLTGITDGAGRVTVLSYSGTLLSSIAAPGCPVVSFTYTGLLLTGISYSDITGRTTFGYESGTNMLTSATNFDGVAVYMAYEAPGSFDAACIDDYAAQQRRVTSMELKNGTALGAKRLFEYSGCVTKVTSVTGTTSNAGKALTYQFNDAGNVVCVTDELGFAQFTEFATDAGKENTPTAGSVLRKAVINKMPNLAFGGSGWIETPNGGSIAKDTSVTCLYAELEVRCLGGGRNDQHHCGGASVERNIHLLALCQDDRRDGRRRVLARRLERNDVRKPEDIDIHGRTERRARCRRLGQAVCHVPVCVRLRRDLGCGDACGFRLGGHGVLLLPADGGGRDRQPTEPSSQRGLYAYDREQ